MIIPQPLFWLVLCKHIANLVHHCFAQIRELTEAAKRNELRAQLKREQLDAIKALLHVHEMINSLVSERLAHTQLQLETTTNNLDYKQTLLETFKEGLEVKTRTLGTLEQAVFEQSRRLEILTTRRNVSQYCLDARKRQIRLLSEHVAGTLEERAKQKEGLAQFHAERLREQELNYKLQTHLAKTHRQILQHRFDVWRKWTEKSKHAKRMLRGTFMVWQMRQLKEVQRACLLAWFEQVKQKKLAREKLARMCGSAEFTLGHLFVKWRSIVQQKNEIAKNHFTSSTCRRVFQAWRNHSSGQSDWRNHQLQIFQAKQHEKQTQLLLRVFSGWRQFTAVTRSNKKSVEKTGDMLLSKTFRAWRGVLQLVHNKQERQHQQNKAKLSFLFSQWREFARKRQLMRKALATMTHTVEAKAFRALRANVHHQQLARRAVGYLRSPLLAKALNKWRSQVVHNKAIRERFFPLNQSIMQQAFNQLRETTKLNQRLRGVVVRMKHPELGRAFNSLKEAVELRKKWQGVAQAYDRSVVRRCFGALRTASAEGSALTLFAKRRAPVFNLRFFFQQWVRHTHENRIRRQVVKRLQSSALQPLFNRWRENARLLKLCRQFLSRLDNGTPKIVFDQWRQYIEFRKQQRKEREQMFLLPARQAFHVWLKLHKSAQFCAKQLVLPTEHSALSRPLAIAAQMPPELWQHLTHVEEGNVKSVCISTGIGALPPRHGHSAVCVDNGGAPEANLRGSLYIFGGRDAKSFFADLVVVDMYGGVSNIVRGGGDDKPQGRAFHSFNLQGSQLILFGGFNSENPQNDTNSVFSDTWSFSLTTHTWTNVVYANKNMNTETLGRCCHTACVFGGSLWVFGGLNNKLECTDSLLRFNFMRAEWVEVISNGDVPSKRSDASCTVVNSSMFIAGGCSERTFFPSSTVNFNDLYEFQFMKRTWIRISAACPVEGQGICLVGTPNKLFVLGGASHENESEQTHSETRAHSLDFATTQWTTHILPKGLPRRVDSALCPVGTHSAFLVGGTSIGSTRDHNDLWRIDFASDTLRLLRVGSVARLEQLATTHTKKAMVCVAHLARNPHNHESLLKSTILLDMIVDHACNSDSSLQPLCFQILSYFCDQSSSTSSPNLRIGPTKALVDRVVNRNLVASSIESWRDGPAGMRGAAAMVFLWMASDPSLVGSVFAAGVTANDIAGIAVSQTKGMPLRTRRRAKETLKCLGLVAESGSPGGVRVVADSPRGVANLAAVFRKSRTANGLDAEAAVEAMVMLSCDERNRQAFTQFFGDDGAALLLSMLDCTNPSVQRCACTLARWLLLSSPQFIPTLVQAGFGDTLSKLAGGDDLGLRASVLALGKLLGQAQSV